MYIRIKSIFLSLGILLSSCIIQAQSFAYADLSDQILKDPGLQLVVIIYKPVAVNEVKAFQKQPAFHKMYTDALDSFNLRWITAVKNNWHLQKNPKFMSIDEVLGLQKSLSKEERGKIVVLACSRIERSLLWGFEAKAKKSDATPLNTFEMYSYGSMETGVGLYSLESKFKIGGEDDETYYQGLSESYKELIIPSVCARYNVAFWYPSYADLAFALNNMQVIMERRAKDKKFKDKTRGGEGGDPAALSNKILLIPMAYTQESKRDAVVRTITDDMIRENYPYPFKVVLQSEIDQAARAKDSRYAILFRSFWPAVPGTGLHEMFFWAVDAADCNTIISYSEPTSKDIVRFTFHERRAKSLGEKKEGKE